MKTKRMIWTIIAVGLIGLGFLTFLIAAALMRFDLTQINTVDFVTNTYTVAEDFTDISIEGAECDINLEFTNDSACRVVCTEGEKITHSVSVQNDTLIVTRHDNREWYDNIGIYWGKISVTVYLPKAQYNSLYVKCVSGDINVPRTFTFENADISNNSGEINFYAKVTGDLSLNNVSGETKVANTAPQSLTVSSKNGDIELENIECATLSAQNTNGKIELEEVLVSGKLEAKTENGNIELDCCDADTLYLKSTTGKIEGSLLTPKNFVTDTVNGKIKVPASSQGGKCEAITTNGNIELEIEK